MPRLASLLPAIPLLLSLSSAIAWPAPHHNSLGRRHSKRTPRVVSDSDSGLSARDTDAEEAVTAAGEHRLAKRGFNGRATFFSVGLGACGNYNQDSDFIVALNQPQYEANNGAWCGKSITISYGGKTAQATIEDECPGCPYGGLDMSPGLFNHFASPDAGVFYMTWSLNDGSGGGGGGGGGDNKPTTTWKPSPTTTWKPAPTTTWSPTPTTTWHPTTTWKPSSTSSSPSAKVMSALVRNGTVSASGSSNSTALLPSASAEPDTTSSNGPNALPAIGAQANPDGSESAQAYGKGNLDTIGGLVVRLGQIALQGAKAAANGS